MLLHGYCSEDDGEQILGYYGPKRLHIFLNFDVAEQGEEIKGAKWRRTFAHEYLHLVQDLTTLYGLGGFVGYYSTAQSIVNLNALAGEIHLPCRDEETLGTREAREWMGWWVKTRGDRRPNGLSSTARVLRVENVTEHQFTVQFTGEKGVSEFPAPVIEVTLSTEAGQHSFYLGAACVGESQAQILEYILARDEGSTPEPAPALPYGALDHLADFVARSGGKRIPTQLLGVLADQAMMTVSPGYYAFKFLQAWSRDRSYGESERDVLRVCEEVLADSKGWDKTTLLRVGLSDLARFCKQFSVSEQKARVFKWFEHVMTNVQRTRRRDPLFFSRPFFSPSPWSALNRMIEVVPAPIIEDNKHRMYQGFIPKESDSQDNIAGEVGLLFSALFHVVQLHLDLGHGAKCPLQEPCDHGHLKDMNCDLAPWTKANRAQTCSMGSAFAMLGVKSKPVVYPARLRGMGSP
jgi:hypothetical protein